MADTLLQELQEDEPYNSASDEEFDPNAAVGEASDISSSSEDEAAPAPRTAKRKAKRKAQDIDGELDSGDEATIAAARPRAKKRKGGAAAATANDDDEGVDAVFLSDEEGGEGGLVKTRAQRRLEQKERRPLARIDGATADVDAIWAKLNSAPIGRPPEPPPHVREEIGRAEKADRGAVEAPEAAAADEEETITIKRTYNFAGEDVTEERQVPKSSAEAKLYLAQQQAAQGASKARSTTKASDTSAAEAADEADEEAEIDEDGDVAVVPDGIDTRPKLRRPLRRPSRFEPNPTAEVRGIPPDAQLTWARRAILADPERAAALSATSAAAADIDKSRAKPRPGVKDKAQRLNTVDKSRLDWAGYVDKEGIADELDEYGRAKEGYLGRMEFLGRVEVRREEGRRGVGGGKAGVE